VAGVDVWVGLPAAGAVLAVAALSLCLAPPGVHVG